MKYYIGFYTGGVTKGLQLPRSEEEKTANAKMMHERLEENWRQIEVAKVLEGMTLHSRQELIGTFCISGPDDAIEKLRQFLAAQKIGGVEEDQQIVLAE